MELNNPFEGTVTGASRITIEALDDIMIAVCTNNWSVVPSLLALKLNDCTS